MTDFRLSRLYRAAVVLAGLVVLLAGAGRLPAQQFDPVEWSLALEPTEAPPGSTVLGRFTATIEEGWHLYSMTNPRGPMGGGIPTEIELAASEAVSDWNVYQPTPQRKFDPNFQAESETFDGEAVFLLEIQLEPDASAGDVMLEASARYQVCSDRYCLNPTTKTATASLAGDPSRTAVSAAIPEGYTHVTPELVAASRAQPSSGSGPARAEQAAAAPSPQQQGFFQFALLAFGFGLLAIFTPCVFPMIPITMSYFVSTQSDQPKSSLTQATVFCLGVITAFTGLGALVSAVLGPFGLAQLGSNVWVNLFIAMVFIVFGASLLGAFEITVPSGALTSLNKVTERGGMAGTLVMGLVFALASFACTGPFVGALLAGSVTGGMLWPLFGMLMFSTGLALPFFFLALFPAYLKRMPKSGGWLARTKVTLGFLILAAAVKYLSTVDQIYQWHILTRERFLAVWIVLFAMAGLYLLGMLRLGDDAPERASLSRLAIGGFLLVVAVSLAPGMFGARLGELEAYVPPPEYSGLSGSALAGSGGSSLQWIKDDYEAALNRARESGKPVLISFTGYSCTNCKWMKANLFPRPEVAAELENLVLVELYTDSADKDKAAKFQRMQSERFQSVAIPFYAIVGPDESTLATFAGLTRDSGEFQEFLRQGVQAQRAEPASQKNLAAAGNPAAP